MLFCISIRYFIDGSTDKIQEIQVLSKDEKS